MSLELKAVAKSFAQGGNALKILADLNLQVAPGEVLAIVGESGSGKSTLLSLIAGFERPDSGRVFWDGQDTSLWTERDWADFRKRRLGFVFQNYHLIPYLNAEENVDLPLRLIGGGNDTEAARNLLARLGLADRGTHLPAQLSGGEKQRVAIARALVHHPQLILADEPTGSLDVKTGQMVLDVLFELLRERRQTALLVTHSTEVARRCDRILILKQGKLWSSAN